MTGRRTRVALCAAGLVLGAAALGFASVEDPREPTTILVLGPLLGWSFVLAGYVASERRPANRVGLLMSLVGITFFLSALSTIDAAVPYTAGRALNTLFFGVFIHLVLAFPSGRL